MPTVAALTYAAAGLCLATMGFFSVGLYLDEWSTSAADATTVLGLYRLCLQAGSSASAGSQGQCAVISWGCQAQVCDVTGACGSWYLFDPAGVPGAGVAFPGRGECGAYDTVRVFLIAAFVATGGVVFMLVSATAEPCSAPSSSASSPGLLCFAGVLASFTAIFYILAVVIFLLDVHNSASSRVGASVYLTSSAAATMVSALVLIVVAACVSVTAVEVKSRGTTIDMKDMKAYRVGKKMVHVPNTQAGAMPAHRQQDSPHQRTHAQRYNPRMRPMGMAEFEIVDYQLGGAAVGEGCAHVTAAVEVDDLPFKGQVAATENSKWATIGSTSRFDCGKQAPPPCRQTQQVMPRITRFGALS